MRLAFFILLCASVLAAQSPPAFHASRVLPSNSDRPAPLTPGSFFSIYGEGLGPAEPCTGHADTKELEKPNPALPAAIQRFTSRLRYPTELCGVRVTVSGISAGLLYVSEGQINFKVPLTLPLEQTAPVVVSFNGKSNPPVSLSAGLPQPRLSLESPAYAGGPIWLSVDLPQGYGPLRYPFSLNPGDFGCNKVEVSRNGTPLQRIQLRTPVSGIMNGLRCGSIGIPHGEPTHTGRLPLHVQYRLDQPGDYEVRYTLTDGSGPLFTSEWTQIEILAGSPAPTIRGVIMTEADLLSDLIPNLLANPSAAALASLESFLYHPEPTIRRFASAALAYWPQAQVDAHLAELAATRGPSDVFPPRPEFASLAVRHLDSNDPAVLAGAIQAVSATLRQHRASLASQTVTELETAFLEAASHIAEHPIQQTIVHYASALGSVQNKRAREILWDFANRNIARDQSLIALCWRKDPRDLPRLGQLLASFRSPEPLDHSLSSLPNVLRGNYGAAALPYLEDALAKSNQTWIRTNCARELVLANRPSGFAFLLDAIEQNRSYKVEMISFLRGQFPELQSAGESALIAFLRQRAR